MVARHCKLGILLFYNKVCQLLCRLCRELIAKAQSIVIKAEADIYKKASLITAQFNEQLVVVVANLAVLTPHWSPSLIKGCTLGTKQRKTLAHRVDWTPLSVTTSFIAVYLTFRRSPYFALAYTANDIVLIVLWILASVKDISYLSVVICFLLFLVNDLYGFVSWRRMEQRQFLET